MGGAQRPRVPPARARARWRDGCAAVGGGGGRFVASRRELFPTHFPRASEGPRRGEACAPHTPAPPRAPSPAQAVPHPPNGLAMPPARAGRGSEVPRGPPSKPTTTSCGHEGRAGGRPRARAGWRGSNRAQQPASGFPPPSPPPAAPPKPPRAGLTPHTIPPPTKRQRRRRRQSVERPTGRRLGRPSGQLTDAAVADDAGTGADGLRPAHPLPHPPRHQCRRLLPRRPPAPPLPCHRLSNESACALVSRCLSG